MLFSQCNNKVQRVTGKQRGKGKGAIRNLPVMPSASWWISEAGIRAYGECFALTRSLPMNSQWLIRIFNQLPLRGQRWHRVNCTSFPFNLVWQGT